MLEKVPYQQRPERFEYRLTDKGLDLWPVIVCAAAVRRPRLRARGPPLVLTHRDCGGAVDAHPAGRCGER